MRRILANREIENERGDVMAAVTTLREQVAGLAGQMLADLRDPTGILAHPRVWNLIDLTQPVALLLVAILHLCADAEDPAGDRGAVPRSRSRDLRQVIRGLSALAALVAVLERSAQA